MKDALHIFSPAEVPYLSLFPPLHSKGTLHSFVARQIRKAARATWAVGAVACRLESRIGKVGNRLVGLAHKVEYAPLQATFTITIPKAEWIEDDPFTVEMKEMDRRHEATRWMFDLDTNYADGAGI